MFVVVVDVRRESGEEIRFREIANGWVDSPLCMQYICVCVVLWQRRMAQMVFRARLPATTMRLNIAAVMMAAVLYKHTYIELNGNGQHRDNIKHSADRSIFFSLSLSLNILVRRSWSHWLSLTPSAARPFNMHGIQCTLPFSVEWFIWLTRTDTLAKIKDDDGNDGAKKLPFTRYTHTHRQTLCMWVCWCVRIVGRGYAIFRQ